MTGYSAYIRIYHNFAKNNVYYLYEYLQKKYFAQDALISHFEKRKTIAHYARQFHLATLVETGTYLGVMTHAMLPVFDKIHTVELSDALYARATRLFRGVAPVQVWHGNSATIIAAIVAQLGGPTLFWLDAHFSGGITARGDTDTPILAELDVILALPAANHVILIDDAHCFDGQNDYPTVATIEKIVTQTNKTYSMETKDNIIRITPRH